MSNIKSMLLVASAMVGTLGGVANAQVLFPPAELRGAGATTIGDVAVRNLNCIGRPSAGLNSYGTSSGALQTIAPKAFTPTTPSASNPVFNCADVVVPGAVTGDEVQPDFEAKYVGTGSGFGRQMWREFANRFVGGVNPMATEINPFQPQTGVWNNLQFAFSEAPSTANELATYTANANNVTNKAGPAIQVPFYVIPVGLAYNPVYGIKNAGLPGQVQYRFNVKFPLTDKFTGQVVGGLRLNKTAYCKIFNGEITNWNDPALRTLNGNTDLRFVDTINPANSDSTTRWATDGVPIRLVGRVDRSGGTDVFTRHLAEVCPNVTYTAPTVNKFVRAAELLPYNNVGGPDMTVFRSDTRYKAGQATTNFAGLTQSISGAFYNASTDIIDTTQGSEATGLFMLADGSSGVEEAIRIATVATLKPSASDGTVSLNGKFGYLGGDFLAPVAGRSLHAAALQVGTSAAYAVPNAANANAALGTILPPQTLAGSGAFNVNDKRILSGSVTMATPAGVLVTRANPLAWTDVLYSKADQLGTFTGPTLANPAKGYPITGSAFLLTYTCFADNADRLGLALWVGATFGKVTKQWDNTGLSVNTFKGTGSTLYGIVTQSNTALPPAAWQGAITETFLKKSAQTSLPTGGTVPVRLDSLGGNGLWIQSKSPTKTTDFDGVATNGEALPNPGCTAGAGA